MRTRLVAVAALATVAMSLVGCTGSTLTALDRTQVDSDTISNAADLELDPASTRLLWEGDGRHFYVAHQSENAQALCLVVVPGGNVDAAFAACSPSDRVGVGMGGEEYLLLRSLVGEESAEWEPLAEGLWRKR